MLLFTTDAFALQVVLSKGNGTDVVVTVYKDVFVKELRENREFMTLGPWVD